MNNLIILILISVLIGCKPSQNSNTAAVKNIETLITTDGTSSGGGSCITEFSCRFTTENKTSIAVVAQCGKLGLAEKKNNEWSYITQVDSHRWTIYRYIEYVLLFKHKLASPEDTTPWIQLEVKLEQKFHEGVYKNAYPALLSGEFKGLDQIFSNEKMICQPGRLQNLAF